MKRQGAMWMTATVLMLLCSSAMAEKATPAEKIADEMNSGGSVMAMIAAEMGLSDVDGAGVAVAAADGPRRPEARDGDRGDMLRRMKDRRREELGEARREEARDTDRGDHPRMDDRREGDRRRPARDGERSEAEARRAQEQTIQRLEQTRRELEAKVTELEQAVRRETQRLEELRQRGDGMRRGPESAAPGRGAQAPAFGPDRRQHPWAGRSSDRDRDRAFGPGGPGYQNPGGPCPLAQGRLGQTPFGGRGFYPRSGRGFGNRAYDGGFGFGRTPMTGWCGRGCSMRGKSGRGSMTSGTRSWQGRQAQPSFRGRSDSRFSGGSPMWRGRESQASPQTKSRWQQGQAFPWSGWGGRNRQAAPQARRQENKPHTAPQRGRPEGRESAQGQRRPGPMFMLSPMGGPIGRLMSPETAEKLRLTEDQRERIHKLASEYREQLGHMGQRVANAIKDAPADQRREKLRGMAGNVKERAGELSRQLKDKVMDVLTPRQREAAKKLLAGEESRSGRETPHASQSRGRRGAGRDRDDDDDEDDD